MPKYDAICVAKRLGSQVKFVLEDVEDTKDAYEKAMKEANRIFGYKEGDAGKPTVSVEVIPQSKE